jgi:tRNA pseudouridine13 synthase
VRKRGLSTWELLDIFKRHTKQVGYAGLKDKHATTTQYLSFDSRDLEKILQIRDKNIEILERFKSKTPLKMGALLGNRFRIWLEGADAKAVAACMRRLEKEGVPNYFGYQRFGKEGLLKARAFVEGELHAQGRLAKMLTGIYQSHLFNRWLAHRIEIGFRFLSGDVVRVKDRLFIAMEEPKEGTITGLLCGNKVVRAKANARKIESLYDEPLLARGERRDALVYPKEVSIQEAKGGVWLSFFLPKGSYATIVLENLLGKELKGA